jgi:hypothetical protein
MDFSDLELLVMNDMYELGYDPSLVADVNLYWETMLNGNWNLFKG